jgi:hypothetical protein
LIGHCPGLAPGTADGSSSQSAALVLTGTKLDVNGEGRSIKGLADVLHRLVLLSPSHVCDVGVVGQLHRRNQPLAGLGAQTCDRAGDAADRMPNVMGSWPFVFGFFAVMLTWAIVNSFFALGGPRGAPQAGHLPPGTNALILRSPRPRWPCATLVRHSGPLQPRTPHRRWMWCPSGAQGNDARRRPGRIDAFNLFRALWTDVLSRGVTSTRAPVGAVRGIVGPVPARGGCPLAREGS